MGMATGGAAEARQWSTKIPDTAIAGPRSEVMVLGSPHLAELSKGAELSGLSAVIDRLAHWRPEAIATENVSGEQCDLLRRHAYRYPGSADTYCPDPAEATKATGLDVPAANAEMDRLLAAWPPAPTPAQRRRLAAVMLAAGESGSAMVQWLRLAPAERRTEGALDATLVAKLERSRTRPNETTLLAAQLAARLGHERLWSVDDHTADGAAPDDDGVIEAALKRVWSGPALERRLAAAKRVEEGLSRPGGMLALYRHYNAEDQAQIAFDTDFGAALRDPSPGFPARRYVGYWETRNLRMVANIRAVLSRRPGMRLLAIVGASHKAYYEAYLAPMHDVRIADVRPYLR